MVRAKDSFKHRFVDYNDDNSYFSLSILCRSMNDSMSDGLDIDDDTNEGLILGITECIDDGDNRRDDGSDNGPGNDDE
jgi:hypothetical protein